MTTFDPAEVRKAVAEFTPQCLQKFQAMEKSLPAVTNARIVPLHFINRSLVMNFNFQDCNNSGCFRLRSAAGVAPARRPQTEAKQFALNRQSDEFVNQ